MVQRCEFLLLGFHYFYDQCVYIIYGLNFIGILKVGEKSHECVLGIETDTLTNDSQLPSSWS